MTKEEALRLTELNSKQKLSPKEKAEQKLLEKKRTKEEKSKLEKKKQPNVFSVEPTTKINPLAIRFLASERTSISELTRDIKSNNFDLIIDKLGTDGLKDINETKLIRAALLLLKQHSHQDIIEAIREVKLNMYRS